MSVYRSETACNLDRALHSIWTDQIRKPQEIILIKDGPLGEDLNQVIEDWRVSLGDLLIVITNEINLGLTKSLNIGLKNVSTDLVARMDSDDISLPKRFELQTSFLERNSSIDIVGGAVEMVDSHGNLKYTRYFPRDHETAVNSICKRSPLAHPAVMMRYSIFSQKKISYDERYRNSQDIALWFDAIAVGCRIANLEDSLLRFTESEDVYMRRGKVRAKNEFLAFYRGIDKLYGRFSIKHIYPMVRYIIRRMPPKLIKILYNSRLYKSSYQ